LAFSTGYAAVWRTDVLTATMTATAAANAYRRHPKVPSHARLSSPSWAFATPEKRTVEGRASAPAVAAKGRSLSQFSHGLTGRYGTMASMPDTGRILTCGYGF
jgi:hypothetical protein